MRRYAIRQGKGTALKVKFFGFERRPVKRGTEAEGNPVWAARKTELKKLPDREFFKNYLSLREVYRPPAKSLSRRLRVQRESEIAVERKFRAQRALSRGDRRTLLKAMGTNYQLGRIIGAERLMMNGHRKRKLA
ncbi:Uncharacterised protein [uncultured archaeon]|nr:Uncharacterised protein [uncultured archaeon]